MSAPFSIRNGEDVALSRRLMEQEALVELSQLALDSGDPYKVMQVAAERLAKIQNMEVVDFSEVVDPGYITVRATVGPSDRLIGTRHPIDPGSPAAQTLEGGLPVLVEQLPTDSRLAGGKLHGNNGYINGLTVIVPAPNGIFGLLNLWTHDRRQFSAGDVHFVQAVARLVGAVITRGEVESRLAEALKEKDRRLHNERALSKCAGALLGDYNPVSVETSLRALMESANASFGHVDWSDKENGASSSVRLLRQGPSEELDRHWDAISWDDLPTLRDQLALGNPVAVRVSDLPPQEASFLLTGPQLIGSKIDIPIVINGMWAGTLGLGDPSEGRVWDRDEIKTLQMAASLLSSWWQRRDNASRLEGALESRNNSLRLEHAVATASQVLSRAGHPDDIEPALEALLEGTDASCVFVERNVFDPDKGLCSRVEAVAKRPGAGYDPRYWDMMPWDRMPTSQDALSRGARLW